MSVFYLCYTALRLTHPARNMHPISFKRAAQVSKEYHPPYKGFLQKSTGFGSCLSCLQPLMIKSNFFFILVFLKAVLLYASQLNPSWKLYSFLWRMKKESTCSEWDALWAGSVRVQETPWDDSKLHHQKHQCLPSMKAQQSTARFD